MKTVGGIRTLCRLILLRGTQAMYAVGVLAENFLSCKFMPAEYILYIYWFYIFINNTHCIAEQAVMNSYSIFIHKSIKILH